MNDDGRIRLTEAALDLVALRKVAVLAHWVPGVNLVLSQDDGPTIAVTADERLEFDTTCLVMHPCEFRRQVLQLMSADEVGLGPSFGLGHGAIHIGVVASPGAVMHDNGLIVARFSENHSIVAHATVVDRASLASRPVTSPPRSCAWPLDDIPVAEDVDPDLGVVLITCGYADDDPTRASLAYGAVFDAMVTSTAEEMSTLVAP
ncbi:MAG: hypothetical protein AAGD35_23480 [Actinomycetota bacterium]